MKRAVIIGAGQTGRGFIAPILKDNDYQITFVDKDEDLIQSLKKTDKYTIKYFGNVAPIRIMEHFEAFTSDTMDAVFSIRDADIVCTSVFSSHLIELVPLLDKAGQLRSKPMQIVCCENGVNVKQDLMDANLNAVITEGIIFCTTLRPNQDSLDLLCENIRDLPIDGTVDGLEINVKRMPKENHFADLIQRKIYTYNFMSAVVAYLGWYKGYEVYGDAANDPDIDRTIQNIKPIVSKVIAKKYNVSYEEQLSFTQRAIDKFQNREIVDTIYRNARQAKRKLGINERILSPLKFAYAQKEDISWIKLIAAAAMDYALVVENENLQSVYKDLLSFLSEKDIDDIKHLVSSFSQKKPLSQIMMDL